MTASRPTPLPDTATVPGFDQVDPMIQWFTGGAAPAATATGVSDATRYGLDLKNSGTGGLTFRATSGDGTHFLVVNNTSTFISGGVEVAGTGVFSGLLLLQAGLTVSTGVSTFSGAVTMAAGLTVTTGATVLGGTLTVSGTSATVLGGALTVTGAVVLSGNATVAGILTVGGNMTVGGNTNFTGAVAMLSTATVSGVFVAATTATITGQINLLGDINHDGDFIGFFTQPPTTQPSVTGSRAGNAALASLCQGLHNLGLIDDNTS